MPIPVSKLDVQLINYMGSGDFEHAAPEDTIFTRFEDGELKIWNADYPDGGWMVLHPPSNDVTLKQVEGRWMWMEGDTPKEG